jgi:8-oxo-dGTP pyrophosphatase MutT (NUDIX family)
MSWQKLSSTTKYQNRYMTVTDDEVLTESGDKLTFGVVHKEPAVWIIPWDGTHLTIIGQYRYAVDYFSWELPAGHAEQNSPENAAALELKEETGITSKKLDLIGKFFVAPGHLTQLGYVYLATDLEHGKRELETAEKGMLVKEVTPIEFEEMIKDGTVKDGPTITAFKLFEIYLSKTR